MTLKFTPEDFDGQKLINRYDNASTYKNFSEVAQAKFDAWLEKQPLSEGHQWTHPNGAKEWRFANGFFTGCTHRARLIIEEIEKKACEHEPDFSGEGDSMTRWCRKCGTELRSRWEEA